MSGLSLRAAGDAARRESWKRLSPMMVHLITAARPNFMKVAPLYHALAAERWCHASFVHAG